MLVLVVTQACYNGPVFHQPLFSVWNQDPLFSNSLNIVFPTGPAVIDTVTVLTSRPSGFVEFDVTSAVKNWHNGESNYGVLLRTSTKYIIRGGIRFFSNAENDVSKHAFINVLCD